MSKQYANAQYMRAYRKRNPEYVKRHNERQKQYLWEKRWSARRDYATSRGLDPDYPSCEACGAVKPITEMNVDHDHNCCPPYTSAGRQLNGWRIPGCDKCRRGLLCRSCNNRRRD